MKIRRPAACKDSNRSAGIGRHLRMESTTIVIVEAEAGGGNTR